MDTQGCLLREAAAARDVNSVWIQSQLCPFVEQGAATLQQQREIPEEQAGEEWSGKEVVSHPLTSSHHLPDGLK